MKLIKKIALFVMCMAMVLVAGNVAKAEAIPRLIITGYDSTPEDVKAGETFTLTLHLENMSKKTAVSNIKLTLSTPDSEFVTVSGSNTLYIEKIAAGETADISVEMQAKTNLDSKTYVLTVASEYEDRYNSVYTDTANVSIPVVQEARISVTELEVSPETIEVGDESNIMFSINNQGRTELYNVNVTIAGEGIKEGVDFVGNIPSGGSGYVDVYVEGKSVTNEENSVAVVTISYEDAEGNVGEVVNEYSLIVEEANVEEEIKQMADEVMVEKHFSPMPIIIGVVIIVAIVVIVVKSNKKKKEEDEDEI